MFGLKSVYFYFIACQITLIKFFTRYRSCFNHECRTWFWRTKIYARGSRKNKNLKGINFENCAQAKDAGANILVSGSTVFKENKGDLKKNIEILRNN